MQPENMPKFDYKAKEGPTKIVGGVIEADTADNAVGKIIRLGLTPIEVHQAVQGESPVSKTTKPLLRLFKRVSLADLVQMTRQMSDLIEAAVPVLRSLQIVLNQTPNPNLKDIVNQMYNYVKDGGSFSDALAQYPDVFPSLYVNMVKTGEISGQLEVVLNRLAAYLEKEQETRGKVVSSLAYPALILIVGILTMFVLLTFVIPRLSVMFDDLGQELPFITVVLMNVSGFFASYWWLILAVIAVAGLYFKNFLNTSNGRRWFDQVKLKIPLLGQFLKIVEIGRFARTLGALLASGVTITTALKSVAETIQNTVLREEVRKISEEVNSGASLRKALKQCSFFPEVAVNMISVGEEIGHLEQGLLKVAETYERQSEQTVKTIVSLLGPLVLVFIVGIVGFVVIAMLLPIFKMNLIIK